MNNITNLIFIFGAKYLYLFVIGIAFVWFLIQPKAAKKEILIIGCISLPLAFIIFKIAGHLFYNPRPFVVGHFTPLIHHAPGNGFPSHHALLVSFVSAVIFAFSRRTGLILWILAAFVGFSRVYAGLHHMIDIIASMLIAIASVTLVYSFVKYFKQRKIS